MARLTKLANELLISLAEAADTPTLAALALTSRQLHSAANPILYRRLLGGDPSATLRWAALHDKPETVLKLGGYQVPSPSSRYRLAPSLINREFYKSLQYGSFRAAYALLDLGARAVHDYDTKVQPKPADEEMMSWLKGHYACGSLAVAAGTRYYLPQGEGERPYASEREFWRWKRKVMLRMLGQLGAAALRGPAENLDQRLNEYRCQVDAALVRAASADAHATSCMELLLTAGAILQLGERCVSSPNALFVAVHDEVPSLCRAKVEFLVNRGTDLCSMLGSEAAAEISRRDVEMRDELSMPKERGSWLTIDDVLEKIRCPDCFAPEPYFGESSVGWKIEHMKKGVRRLETLHESWVAGNNKTC